MSEFSKEDLDQISALGLTEAAIRKQLEIFKRGLPPIQLLRPCTVGDGIRALKPEAIDRFQIRYQKAANAGKSMKFVPASGAATRMFELLSWMYGRKDAVTLDRIIQNAANSKDDKEFLYFWENLAKFPFYESFKQAVAQKGESLDAYYSSGKIKAVLEFILTEKGLGYVNIPKGLIPFHRYSDHQRTAFEEQLVEAASYCVDKKGMARIHFTVQPEWLATIKNHLQVQRKRYEKDVQFQIEYSCQDHSADTIAADSLNRPFRDKDGKLVFRPGGHGALLRNLKQLDAEVIFIKNVDNVSPDQRKKDTFLYKKVLAGLLLETQDQIFEWVRKFKKGKVTEPEITKAAAFAEKELGIELPSDFKKQTAAAKIKFLLKKFQRPLRVCGVVKNQGEPGGGPFWMKDKEGFASLQIIEASQVDTSQAVQKKIWQASTHFNPVMMVCGFYDETGKKFELDSFVDPDMAFISTKSKEGRELKALEYPGLWNGAMANWNTLFVEIPLNTFSPVKTVLDLLRPEHQA